MMFAHAEEIEADLIRECALLDDLPKRFGLRQLFSVLVNGYVSERVETHFGAPTAWTLRGGVDFNRLRHLGALSLGVSLWRASRAETVMRIGNKNKICVCGCITV